MGLNFEVGYVTTWMHFLSDSIETFVDVMDNMYPFAFMFCTLGYLITMLANLIVAWVYKKQNGSNIIAIPLQILINILPYNK